METMNSHMLRYEYLRTGECSNIIIEKLKSDANNDAIRIKADKKN